MNFSRYLFLFAIVLSLSACAKAYYNSLEAIGIPKRDLMVYRVEKARDTQEETKEQFESALEQFTAVTQFEGGDLEDQYNKLNSEYEASVDQAEQVRKHINAIEEVSEALFTEWEQEIEQYSSASLKRDSTQQLSKTRSHYQQLIVAMNRAEARIDPVLAVFKDQVLFLKHNLNARAIASLKGELRTVESDVSSLIAAMEKSINEANAFIQVIEK